jgi:uncharacterized cysteine cluster protein YcgN (CxxCxxCC family)
MAKKIENFWETKTLSEFTEDEWESLCDGCGKCCLHKLEDEDTDELYFTDVACRLLDIEKCRCKEYGQRKELVSDCLMIRQMDRENFSWLPSTCAYRLLEEGKPLFDWHPLVCGNHQEVINAGVSVAGRVLSEKSVHPDDLESRIIHWVD